MGQGDEAKEEVRTLFISGLPDDVKEREIYNLFQTFPGYEFCQLKYTGRGYQIVAFVVFSDQASALAAKEAVNGLKFDPQSSATLNIELARANSRAKRPYTDDGGITTMEKKPRMPVGVPGLLADSGMHMPGLVHSVYNDMSGFPPSQSASMMGAPYSMQDGIPGRTMVPKIIPPLPTPGSNPPCSTLFVANLGPTCSEAELMHVLGSFPGFVKLKMQMKGGLPVAFVDFQDEMCSTHALTQLQNFSLPSSDRGGMRLEYAKERMGLPRRGKYN